MYKKRSLPPSERWPHATPPQPGKAPYRLVLWAILALALFMLTTFVIFGANGAGLVTEATPQIQPASPGPATP